MKLYNAFNKKVLVTLLLSVTFLSFIGYKNINSIKFVDYVDSYSPLFLEYLNINKIYCADFYKPSTVYAKEVVNDKDIGVENINNLQIKTKDMNIVNDIIDTFNNIYKTDEKDVKIMNIMNITNYMDKNLGTELINELYDLFQDNKFELKYYLYDYMLNSTIDVKSLDEYKILYPDYETDNFLKFLLVLVPDDNYNMIKVIKFIINDNNILEFKVY